MTMTALRRTAPGSLEALSVPRPIAEDDVLVEVTYAAVNPFDAQVLRGEIGDPTTVLTLGAEGAGLLDGQPVQISGAGLGVARDGTFAPWVRAPRTAVRPLPGGADLRLAATVGVAGKTAWRAIHQLAQVTPDDRVLVLGATGGVGTFAAQLARRTGATVLAHTGSQEKAEMLAALGLETLVADGAGSVAEAARGRDVSVVLDPLGGDYVAQLLPVLSPSARVVTYGVLAGRAATIDLAALYGKGIRIIGTSGGTTPLKEAEAALSGALGAVLSGEVRVAHEVMPLTEGAAAFRRLETRDVTGKLLLAPR
ncbi:quinone oxidoreductase family protein [Nocardioides daejeonensis]|uniref:quinone oxidoreductase family protein n=1 Tax=Nocardioides daejeonensis TaxID=1046556 RepID=UPI000D7471AB|nr:zinc-binding alcohol dehydrogenase family protein [Nocardioides daejeonensis]